jgi:predicted RNA-binding protein YlqC (UPF0109 family)
MKNLLEFLLIHLCNHPEDVKVEETQTDRETVYTLYVHAEDMGRVIGKNGSIIQAIRSIAKVRAIKEGIRAQIVLADPELDAVAPTEEAPVEVAA